MKRVLGGSLVLPLCLSMGCSTSGGGSGADPSGSNSNGGGGGNGPYGGSGAIPFNPFTTGGTAVNATGTGLLDAGCAADDNPAELTQVNILVLLDKSGSMGYQYKTDGSLDWDHCEDRWNPVIRTLNAFFGQKDSSRLYAALSFLPADGGNTTMCDPKTYSSGTAALKVPLTLLDDTGRQKFLAKLCDCAAGVDPPSASCIVPAGGTPTRPALQGTINYAGTVTQKYPGSKTVIVLITDGEPSFACQNEEGAKQTCNSCEDLTNGCLKDASMCLDQPTEIDKITAVILQAAPTQPIHVVGVGTNLSDTTLGDWATASGNPAVDLRALDGSTAAIQLMATLESIRQSSIKCDFDVPHPKGGDTIDPVNTFVYYTPGSGDGDYLNQTTDGTSATCSGVDKGWYFDNPTVPTTITLCGTTCQALQQDSKGKLEVNFGCKSHSIVL